MRLLKYLKIHSLPSTLNPSQHGFTLMEIVVSTTIFATVLTLMLSLFNFTLKINRRTEALRQTTQGMRTFTEYIVKEIRNGQIDYSNVIAQCSGNYDTASGYTTFLGVVNSSGQQECFDWSGVQTKLLYLYKNGVAAQTINPANFSVDLVKFYVRPTCDPETQCYSGEYPAIQPFVTIVMQFTVTLPSGEIRTIPYQTSVSTDQYDVPDNN